MGERFSSNAVANTNAAVYNGTYARSSKLPAKKFAKKIQEVTIEDKDVSDLVVELGFGATISGTVTIEGDSKDMPNSVMLQATNENEDISSTDQLHNYDYDEDSGPRKLNRDFSIEGVMAGRTYLTAHLDEAHVYLKSATANGVDLLKDGFDVKEGEVLRNVQIVLAKDVGTAKGKIIDPDKQPIAGVLISLVPTDPAKFRNSSFYRSARSDQNGEFEVKLAPLEYAIVSFPARAAEKGRQDFHKWLATAVKSAQTFKIEAGKTEKITIKRDTGKAPPSQ